MQDFIQWQKIKPNDFQSIVQNVNQSLSCLKSDDGYVQEIPDSLIEIVDSDRHAKIFIISKHVREYKTLPPGVHLLVYSPEMMYYECTCGLAQLEGLICIHFLTVFAADDEVHFHHKLYSSRWFNTEASIYESIVPFNCFDHTCEVSQNVQDFHTARSANLFGSVPLNEDDIQGEATLDEATVLRRSAMREELLCTASAPLDRLIQKPGLEFEAYFNDAMRYFESHPFGVLSALHIPPKKRSSKAKAPHKKFSDARKPNKRQ
jgi:hypothetical protein